MERPGEIIRRLRKERGLTQADACRLAGLPAATWRTAESGSTARPRPVTKLRIARALGVTPSSIWGLHPRPLHLADVDDPRWEPAVLSMSRRLDREGSEQERRHLGRRLVSVLDCVDDASRHGGPDEARWDELWRIGTSLAGDPPRSPLRIVDGRLIERGLDGWGAMDADALIAAQRHAAPAHVRQ